MSPEYSASSESDSRDNHVSWKQDPAMIQKKYFQKFEKPTISLSEHEVLENKDKILETIRVSRKSSLNDRKSVDKAIQWNTHQDKALWEKPKRFLIRNIPSFGVKNL
jgi:hypothetical protein